MLSFKYIVLYYYSYKKHQLFLFFNRGENLRGTYLLYFQAILLYSYKNNFKCLKSQNIFNILSCIENVNINILSTVIQYIKKNSFYPKLV